MVNTPFFMSPAQQVLVKGVQICQSNLQEVIAFVESQFHLLEGKIADVSATVHEQNETQKVGFIKHSLHLQICFLDATRRYGCWFI